MSSNSSNDGCESCLGWFYILFILGGSIAFIFGDRSDNSTSAIFLLLFFIIIAMLGAIYSRIKDGWDKAQIKRRNKKFRVSQAHATYQYQSTPNRTYDMDQQAQDIQQLLLLIYRSQDRHGLETYLQSTGIPSNQIDKIVEAIQIIDLQTPY